MDGQNQLKKPSGEKKKIILSIIIPLLVILISIAAIGLKIYSRNIAKNNSKIPDDSVKQLAPNVADTNFVKNFFLSDGIFTFPVIKETSVIGLNEMPGDLLGLIPQGINNPEFKKIKYNNDLRTGYQINFKNTESLFGLNNKYYLSLGLGGWTVVAGRVGNLFSFIDAEKSNYTARVSETFIKDGEYSESVDITTKTK